MAAADPIDAYLISLDRRLFGPRRAKRDLLREARDSLIDAAEAHRRAGLDARRAQERAVTEFGAVGRIAPGYQVELAVTATWRLGLLLAAAAACGMLFGDLTWRGAPWTTIEPPTGYLIVARALDSMGYVVAAVALSTLVLLLTLARSSRDPRRVCRAISLAVLTSAGLTMLLGAAIFAFTVVLHPPALTWPPMIAGGVLGTAAWGWQLAAALGCLRATRRAPVLRPALAGSRPGTC